MDPDLLAFVGLGVLALASFVWGIAQLWREAHGTQPRRVNRRIQSASGHATSDQVTVADRRSRSGPQWRRLFGMHSAVGAALRRLLAQSGSGMSPTRFVTWSLALGVAGLLIAAGFRFALPVVVVMVVASTLMPLGNVLRLRYRRTQLIEAQIPEALDLMVRAMQAGRSLSNAIRTVGLEGPSPIAREFRTTFDEINFGLAEDAALTNLAGRTRIGDLRYFVVAVLIQRQAGGNLAELLKSISALVRERIALRGVVRVMSAEGRLSAWILGLLPFVISLLISLINPGFFKVLWTEGVGIQMVAGALGLLALGVAWMWVIIRIRV
jgi:tight adherence protein B